MSAHIYDLRHDVDRDDWELGIRVACALFAENVPHHTAKIDAIRFRGFQPILVGKRQRS